jgi:hypothetical protein
MKYKTMCQNILLIFDKCENRERPAIQIQRPAVNVSSIYKKTNKNFNYIFKSVYLSVSEYKLFGGYIHNF